MAPTTADTLRRRCGFIESARAAAARPQRPRARRPQHGAAAALTAAAAREHLVDVRRVVAFALNLVVVGELLARLDGADRIDEHPSGLDHRFAVRLAGMK